MAATDPYAALRSSWSAYLSGGAIDPGNAVYAPALAGLNSLTQAWSGSMQVGSGRAALWTDLPLGTVSANITSSLNRLRTLALAYVTPGSGYTGSATVAAAVTGGLDFMVGGPYSASTAMYDNWWDWQIGATQALEDAAILMYPALSAAQVASYCAVIDAFVPDPAKQRSVSGGVTTSTGANRLDLCRSVIVRGALGGAATPISTGVAAMSPALPLVMWSDGLYADGSFIQHGGVAYTGTYGKIFFADVVALALLLKDSSWAITDPNLAVVFDGVDTALAPVVYNGLMIDAVRGRAVSRFNETDAQDGFSAALTVLRYAQATADPAKAAAWRAAAKGWLQRNTSCTVATTTQQVVDFTSGASVTVSVPGVSGIAVAESVLADGSVAAAPEPAGHRQFPVMARAIHRRPGWAYSLAMSSWLVERYEAINGENVHGWYTGDGMGYLYLDGDVAQFNDAFWDTVDPLRLPGVTADSGTVAASAGEATKPSTRWVGGAASGAYGSVGMQLQAYSNGLTGCKSWFCLDDEVVALGAGITSSSGDTVRTTVENRNLHSAGANTLYVNGAAQSTSPGWSTTVSAVHSACISGVAGYYFLWPAGANNVEFALTNQTGNWHTVNGLAPSTLADDTRPYLSIAFNHGANPAGATYSYVVLPGATPAQTAAYAASPEVGVLSNTASVQAITHAGLGVTMANFFAAGTAGAITVSAPASVVTRENGGSLTIAVSDPTWGSSTVQVVVAASGYVSVVSGDPGVTVLSTSGGQVKLLVETGGSRGSSHSVTLSTSGTALTPCTATALAATDNCYVRDGSYAATNYGGQTTMVVKSASSGYDRVSLLKFDTAAITGSVTRAVLWVNGYVADSGGSMTTVGAYGLSSSSWSEATVTWNTAPAIRTAYGSGPLSNTADWVGLDVTGLVQAAAASGVVAIGVSQAAAGLAAILATNHGAVGTAPVLEVVTD
ncbi:polysaccharide lyase 8 family protein [Catenulispora subtropica]|uniref:Polysaccharide lyase 8 family protein n=2 Tax=Catenulispora subtropica TaxID=450798 RepID=A0ABP5CJY1_9ACTN